MHGKEFRVVFSSAEWFWTEFRECASTVFWFHGMVFRVVISSAEGFGTKLWGFASIFVPRNGVPSYFLFRGRVRNGIPRFSVPRNNRNFVGNNYLFRLFRLPRNYFFVGNSQPYSNLLSGSPPPPLPVSKYSLCRQCVAGRGWMLLSPVGDHILQEFNTMYLTRFRACKTARPPQTKT